MNGGQYYQSTWSEITWNAQLTVSVWFAWPDEAGERGTLGNMEETPKWEGGALRREKEATE